MADDIQSNININIDTSQALDSLRMLRNEISAFHTQMAKMGAANAAQAANMRQNLINSINAGGQFSASITKIKTSAESFTQSLEKNKFSLNEYFRYSLASTRTFGKYFATEFETINKVARERVKDLQSQYIKLGRDASGAMQAIKVRPLMLDMDNLATKTQIAAQRQQLLNQLLKQGSTNLLNFGKNTQWAGRQLMVGFTVPLTMMGAAAAKAYQQMEEAAIKFKRVYGDMSTTNAETEKMVKNVQQLALEYTKYGIKVQETMSMAADAAAMGKTGADLLQQVASANKLAALGAVEQSKALETTISLTNAFSISSRNLGESINFLNSVENQTVLNIEDMTTAIPKAAPVIKQLGGDVKDLAFFMTAMKEGGINASEGANALKSGLASLINPTGKAAEMLAGFGINVKKIVESNKGDLRATVIEFAKALDTLDPLNRAKAIEQMFGKFQFARLSTLFQNITQEGTQAARVLELASKSSLELSMMAQRELGKIEQSPLFQFQKSIANFQAQLAPVGEQFLKAITPIINFATKMLEGFNNLNDGVKQFIVQVVGIGGVVGPVLLMSFGLIANAVANVIKGFALVKDIFNKTGKSSMSLGDQVNYMTQQQIEAAAIASSLDQVHSKLKQTFTSEAAAVDMLTKAYERSVAAQRALGVPITPRGPVRKYASGGVVRGPGTGTSDSILAMVSNGEAIIPAKSVARNPQLVQQLVTGNIPGFRQGKYGDVPTYGEYGLRLQNARENMRKQSSPGSVPEILSFAAIRIGEAMGIRPTESSVNKGLFDSIYKKYEQVYTKYVDKIKLEFDTTFSSISDTNERMRQARLTAAKFVEAEAMQLATSDAEKLALRRSLGLDEDFYGSAPTMPRRKGGRFLERARKSIYDLKTTGIRGYVSIGGAAKSLYSRITGQSSEDYQLGHFNEPRYVSGQELAKSPNLSNAAKKALESIGITIGKQAEQSVVAGVKASTKQKSPSKDGFDAGANIGKGAVQGIQSGIDDARNAGTMVGAAAASGIVSGGAAAGVRDKDGTPIALPMPIERQSRRVSSGSNLVWDDATGTYIPEHLMGRPMYGPPKPTTMQKLQSKFAGPGPKLANLFGRAGVKLSNVEPQKFQGRTLGASMITGLGSMIPGPIGQVSGALSMPLMAAGMFPEFFQKNLPKLMFSLGRLVPYVGVAVTAFELFDKVIYPAIRKNADAFNAIADTLTVTQDKIDKINNFFGTEIKLAGIRASTAVSGEQNKEQATIAQQFQQSQEFKDVYQANAQKMRGLSVSDFSSAMQAMAVDLFGQGMAKEQVTAIIDAIALEAGKSSVSIAPELFSIKNPQTKALMNKNIQDAFAEISSATKTINQGVLNPEGRTLKAGLGEFDNWFLTPVDPESVAKIKAGATEIASYMSALSGQFANGEISANEFTIQYDKLLQISNKQPGTSGLEALKAAFISLNKEAGTALANLGKTDFGIVSEALLAGVTPTLESYKVFDAGTDKQIKEQVRLYGIALKQQKELNSQVVEKEKQIRGIQQSTLDIEKLEKSINEKYDARIKQIEKIKRLNQQISEEQQGQLDLAEALNRGDVGAAARISREIQQKNVENALERQQQALEDARQAELKPLQEQKDTASQTVININNQIADIIKNGIKVQNLPQGELDKIITIDDILFGNNSDRFDKDVIGALKKASGRGEASGGYISGPGSGTSDSIPAMLSNGEYVIRANAVKTIGTDVLDKLNYADRIKFANGGMVRGYDEGGQVRRYGDERRDSSMFKSSKAKKLNLTLDDIAAGLSNPLISGGGYGSDVSSGFALAESYQRIFSGKGDFWDWFGGLTAPFALSGLAGGPSRVGSLVRTGMGVRGAKNALSAAGSRLDSSFNPKTYEMVRGVAGLAEKVGKLTPRLAFNIGDEALLQMIKDGRYQNLRAGVRSSTTDTLEKRIAVEQATMGISPNAKPGKTPAYGFLTTQEDVLPYYNSIMGGMGPTPFGQSPIDNFNQLINPTSRYLSGYGNNTIVLKSKALGKATISFGDTLSIFDKANRLGQKAPKVTKLNSITSAFPFLRNKVNRIQDMMKQQVPNYKEPAQFPYIEAHLPGGFTLDDIESIMVSPSSAIPDRLEESIAFDIAERVTALKQQLKQAGISGIKVKPDSRYADVKKLQRDFFAENPGASQRTMLESLRYPLPQKLVKPNILDKLKPGAYNIFRKARGIKRDIETVMLEKLYALQLGNKLKGVELEKFATSAQRRGFDIKANTDLNNFYRAVGNMKLGKNFNASIDEIEWGMPNVDLEDYEGEELFLQIAGAIYKKQPGGLSVKAGQYSGYIDVQEKILGDVYLELAKKFRGKGVAQKFTTQFQRLLGKAGIDQVQINASMTDGGYAWAKAGFDFDGYPHDLVTRMQTIEPYVRDRKFHKILGELKASRGKQPLTSPKDFLSLKQKVQSLFDEEDLRKIFVAYGGYGRNMDITKELYRKNVTLGEMLLRGSTWEGFKDLNTKTDSKEKFLEMLTLLGAGRYANGGLVRGFANGGMVSNKYAMGGLAMGTDIVPAMLTPGEFVIKKSAVDRIGPANLNKINGYADGGLVGGTGNSTSIGDSVYNYSINVNVSSQSDPNQIARVVMNEIRKVDNQQVRGSVF